MESENCPPSPLSLALRTWRVVLCLEEDGTTNTPEAISPERSSRSVTAGAKSRGRIDEGITLDVSWTSTECVMGMEGRSDGSE